MISKDDFFNEEKDCADMLGVSIEEYRNDLKNTKLPTKEIKKNNYSFDNSFLNYLGLNEECLKKRRSKQFYL